MLTRITSQIVENNLLSAINRAQQNETQAMGEVQSGQAVTQPSDNPAAAALYSLSQSQSAAVTQYMQNINTLTGQVQTAGSALQSSVTLLNQAITLGVQGASSDTGQMTTLATQAGQLQQQLLSLANTSFQGSPLFGGGASGPAFTSGGSGVTYTGNSAVNQVEIAAGESIAANVPGDQIFTSSSGNAFQALSDLQTALQNGDSAGAATAVTELKNALNVVNQQQEVYSSRQSDLASTQTWLNSESTDLSQQQTSLIGANMADAITNLSSTQQTLSAILDAGSLLNQSNLLSLGGTTTATGA